MLNIFSRMLRINRFGEMQKVRALFIIEACIGTALFNLATGAFLAGFAVSLGASDWLCGLLGVIPMMAGMAQIFSPLILERVKDRRPVVASFLSLHKVLLCTVVLIPLLISNTSARLVALLVFLLLSFFSCNIIWPGYSTWLTSVTSEETRGRFFGIKDSYALTVNTIVLLIMGFVLDSFKRPGNKSPDFEGFVAVYSVAAVLAVINIFILFKLRGPETQPSITPIKLRDCFTKPLADKGYLKLVVFFSLWNFGLNIGAPFLPVYQVKYLNLDYKYIMILNLLYNITMVISVRFWGRYADRTSWVHSSVLSVGVLAITHFLWVFISGDFLYLLPLVFITNGIAFGGINISLFNLPFLFAPQENKTIYLGFNAALGGVSGLAATLLGGRLVEVVENGTGMGIPGISGIQTVILLSSLLLATCSFYGGRKLMSRVEGRSLDI